MGQLDNSCVYINKVGAFSVNCASYWWTRIAACGVRATHHLFRRWPGVASHHSEGADRYRPQLLLPDGRWDTPLNGRGGYRVEWLGMETEYSRPSSVGLSSLWTLRPKMAGHGWGLHGASLAARGRGFL